MISGVFSLLITSEMPSVSAASQEELFCVILSTLTDQKQTTTPKQQSAIFKCKGKCTPNFTLFSKFRQLKKKKKFCLLASQYSAKSQSDYYLYLLLVNTIDLFLWSDENYIDFAAIGFLLISCQQSHALCLLLCSNPISP